MILPALALLVADLPVASQAPQPAASIVIPAQTLIQLSTVDPVDSRSVKQGQRFALRVSEDVTVGAAVVIPRGTPAVGEVEALSGKGMVGKAGRLELRPLFIDVAGERVNLVGTSNERGKDSTAGVAVGSLLLSGWGIFITGKSASVPAGSPLPGRVRSDVALPVPAAPKAIVPSPPAAVDSTGVQTPVSEPDNK
jgi:hypothetical protein